MTPRVGAVGGIAELASFYAAPPLGVRANMIFSADGAAAFAGRAGPLSCPTDQQLLRLLRGFADVVLVGAGTARIEEYKPARRRPALEDDLRAGRPSTVPIALVSRKLDLDFAAPLFTGAPPDARTIVITCAGSPDDKRAAAARVADVIVAGELAVDLKEAVVALRDRGLGQVLCEGGPHLLGDLTQAGLVDEFCLSLSPTLAGPGASRVIEGALGPARPMTLKHVLADDDGFLFFRYFAQENQQ